MHILFMEIESGSLKKDLTKRYRGHFWFCVTGAGIGLVDWVKENLVSSGGIIMHLNLRDKETDC